jgi:hypothetical protein
MLKLEIIFFTSLITLGVKSANTTETTSCPISRCTCETAKFIKCENFTSFSELDFKSINFTEINVLELRPLDPLILDNSLNLSSITIINKQVILSNIRGFMLNSNPFESINQNMKKKNIIELKLYDSEFEFYESEETKLESKCNKYELINRNAFNNTILSRFSTVSLSKNVKYSNNMCPFVFQNAKIDLFLINNINETNRLGIKTVNLTENDYKNANLSISINQLYLFNVNLTRLDDELLSRIVFSSIKTLQFYGNLTEIQSDLFGASFKNLKSLVLDLFNFDQFIRNKNNDWMSSLGSYERPGISSNGSRSIYSSRIDLLVHLNDRKEEFVFDDADFCLFAKFPINKHVYPLIKTKDNLNCSCTLIWLIKEYKNFLNRQQFALFKTKSVEKCLDEVSEDFSTFESECNFDEKILSCEDKFQRKSSENVQLSNNGLLFGQAIDILPSLQNITNNQTASILSTIGTRALAFFIGAFGFMSTVLSIMLAIL